MERARPHAATPPPPRGRHPGAAPGRPFRRRAALIRRRTLWGVTRALLVGAAGTLAPPAAAEPFLDGFTGKSFTLNSDIRLNQPAFGSDFTFEDVSFKDKSFVDPPYYGWRLGYFFERYPWLGAAVEFIHFKIYAETSDTRRLTGTRRGSPVNVSVPVNSIVQDFSVSHGVNYLMFDALVRYPLLADPERFPRGRVQLYGGLGVGPVIAHPENRVDNIANDDAYEVGGVGFQVFVGGRALLFKYFGVFGEYKFTHSRLDVSLASGRGRVAENTHHLIFGLTIHLPPLF